MIKDISGLIIIILIFITCLHIWNLKYKKKERVNSLALFFCRYPESFFQKSESEFVLYRPPLFVSVYIAALTPCSPQTKTNDLTIKCKSC